MMGRSITEVIPLIKDLPSHCDQLLSILDAVLTDFRKMCRDMYASIVSQNDTDEKRVVSATWVTDEDIERLLKSLPNWSTLQKQRDGKLSESLIESPDDLHSQNIRESDLLYGVFGGKKLQTSEILSNLKQLQQLAHFQESMVCNHESIVSYIVNSVKNNTNLTWCLDRSGLVCRNYS